MGEETGSLPMRYQEGYSAPRRRMVARPVRNRTAIVARRLQTGGAVQSVLLQQASNNGRTDFYEADFL